jgi:hypothetical protein
LKVQSSKVQGSKAQESRAKKSRVCRSGINIHFELIEMRGQGAFSVMPAKAGIQTSSYRIFWISAFAGMTVYNAISFPTAHTN